MALVDVNIKVPVEMAVYLKPFDQVTELERNALLLYPYVLKQSISHGRAAEILGIRKNELIDIYDKFGFSYLDLTMDDLDAELETYRNMKEFDFSRSIAKHSIDIPHSIISIRGKSFPDIIIKSNIYQTYEKGYGLYYALERILDENRQPLSLSNIENMSTEVIDIRKRKTAFDITSKVIGGVFDLIRELVGLAFTPLGFLFVLGALFWMYLIHEIFF